MTKKHQRATFASTDANPLRIEHHVNTNGAEAASISHTKDLSCAVDYEGAAVTLDWDRNGDLQSAHIGIWRFTDDERIETVEVVPWQR